MGIVYFVLTFVFNAAANILLKISSKKGFQFAGLDFWQIITVNYLLIIGLACFATSALFYFLSLRSLPISIAYPVMVGAALILINTFALVYLHERIIWPQIIGYACLLLGMFLIYYFNPSK